MSLLLLLREAIKKVPSLKFALGIVGIAACVAIIKSFKIDNYIIPVKALYTLIILMLSLFIFSKIADSRHSVYKFAGYILIFSTVAVIVIGTLFFFTSVFFDFPKPINEFPFFKEQKSIIVKIDTTITNPTKKEIVEVKTRQNTSQELEKNNVTEVQKTFVKNFEISIQLDSYTQGYKVVKINGREADVLASSTIFNPRVMVENKFNEMQLIEIITNEGDTGFIKRIFSEVEKQNFPIRFVPEFKNK